MVNRLKWYQIDLEMSCFVLEGFVVATTCYTLGEAQWLIVNVQSNDECWCYDGPSSGLLSGAIFLGFYVCEC